MAVLLPVNGKSPEVGENCFLAPNATLVGDVKMGNDCSIWFSAVVRGDVNSIILGDKVNIQDGAVIHCTYKKSITRVGNNVSIGHNAIVHGCIIEDNVLVGMGSVIMDNAVVRSGCIVAAGAVVPENMELESGYIYAGVPAKKLKKASKEQAQFFIERTAHNYVKYASWFKSS